MIHVVSKVIHSLQTKERAKKRKNVIESAQLDGYETALIDIGHAFANEFADDPDFDEAEFRTMCGYGDMK